MRMPRLSGLRAMRAYTLCALSSVMVLVLLPCAAARFAGECAGLPLFFLLLFVVNPVYAVIVGVFAGQDAARLWALPAVPALVFLAGAMAFFASGETAFVLYALAYLALGVAAMLISWRLSCKSKS